MTITQSILGIVPGLQATALVGHNLKYVDQSLKLKPGRSPLKPAKSMLKMGVTNLIGIGLIKPTAQMINTL